MVWRTAISVLPERDCEHAGDTPGTLLCLMLRSSLAALLAATATAARPSIYSLSSCIEETITTSTGTRETCAEAFERGVPCHQLYRSGHRCCLRCDRCGIDGSLCADAASSGAGSSWISPACRCDQVVVSGACSLTGCAKPDALGIYTRRRGWRTSDGRYVYVKDSEQPTAHQHFEVEAHRAIDDSSGTNSTDVPTYLYFHPSLSSWVIGPRQELTDDNYARSASTAAPCPDEAAGPWRFWWGGVASLSLPTGFRITGTRGWKASSRYPLRVSCWV